MKVHRIIAITAVAVLAVPIYSSAAENEVDYKIVGYLPDWNYNPFSELDLSQLTHINIAFCNPDEAGKLYCNIPDSTLKSIVAEAHNNNVEVFAAPDAELQNWKAGDLCEDGIIDVFDLCVMRKMLIK